MTQVNMLEAKSSLSALVKQLEDGYEDGIIIARNGHPVALLTRYQPDAASQRIGIARDRQLVADDWDINEDDDKIADLFGMA